MMKTKMMPLFIVFMAISLVCAVSTVSGEEYKAMTGIKSAKAVFDERQSDPKSAALHLKVVHRRLKNWKG
jgi:hypothetical protein